MIGSRRWRSISFWTNGVGTDSRANPSAMTSGLTSFSQALCWGVRTGTGVTVRHSDRFDVAVEFGDDVFQTATNGGSGSAVNDAYPLAADSGTAKWNEDELST